MIPQDGPQRDGPRRLTRANLRPGPHTCADLPRESRRNAAFIGAGWLLSMALAGNGREIIQTPGKANLTLCRSEPRFWI
jgi:hypothetical protein